MKTYIGIDNGKKGAITVLDENHKILSSKVLPMVGTTKKDYDIPMIVEMLRNWDPEIVVLEKVPYLPSHMRGGIAGVSLGRCVGMLEGICATLGYPYIIVSPKEWQKSILSGLDRKDTKAASIMFAKRMWPKQSWLATNRSRKDHDGMTDSACMALYGITKYK